MSCTEFAKQYAPALVELAEQVDSYGYALPGWTAGPQGTETVPCEQEPHLVLQLFEYQGIRPVVYVFSAERCVVYVEFEDPYEITFQGIIKYLAQFPKPLHTYSDTLESES